MEKVENQYMSGDMLNNDIVKFVYHYNKSREHIHGKWVENPIDQV